MAESRHTGTDNSRNSWNVVTIDDLKSRVKSAIAIGPFGSRMKSDAYVEDGVPVIRGKNISSGRSLEGEFVFVSDETADELRSSNVVPDDLVFPHRGAIGMVGIVPRTGPKRWMLSTSLMKLSVDPRRADPLFLFYFFRSAVGRDQLLRRSSNVGTPGIAQPLTSLRAITLALPPLGTQRAVVRVLGAMDDLIENNLRRVEVLEDMARTIYREWFVHFRYPGHEEVPLVDSPLGPIPDGWNSRPLVDIADITMGQSPKSEFYNAEGVGKPFHQGVADFGRHYPVHRKFCTVDARLARDGDVLVSVRAPVGRINVADTALVIGRGLAAVRSRTGEQSFLFAALKEVFAEEDSMGGGTIFNAIGKKELEQVPLLQPPDRLLREANDRLAAMFNVIRSLTFAERELAAIRDLLLPKLVTGQIDVSNLDLDSLTEAVSV